MVERATPDKHSPIAGPGAAASEHANRVEPESALLAAKSEDELDEQGMQLLPPPHA